MLSKVSVSRAPSTEHSRTCVTDCVGFATEAMDVNVRYKIAKTSEKVQDYMQKTDLFSACAIALSTTPPLMSIEWPALQ
jgi:hypothetical protein